jgi:predicted nucleic acid-binding protein
MMRLVFLDTGIVGMVANPRSKPRNVQCCQWTRDLWAAGVPVFVPEICDYEVRRKLIHARSTSGIARLDRLKVGFDYAPITTDVMLFAADLWAQARRRGRPTAAPAEIDGDVILAAQALLSAGPGDTVTVATDNVGHLAQFVDAQPWEKIVP